MYCLSKDSLNLFRFQVPPCISSGFPNIHQYPFILLGGERHGESKVSCPRTKQSLTQPGLEPRPLVPKSSTMTIRSQYVFHCCQEMAMFITGKKQYGALLRSHSSLIKYRPRSHQSFFVCLSKKSVNKLHKISTAPNFKNLPNFCRSPKFS